MTSILKKALMAITGLLLVGFLVAHLSGNVMIYFGAATFNAYAGFLDDKPVLVASMEAGLLLIFLLHIYLALRLTLENSAARPKSYEVSKPAGQATFASRTMWYTGLAVMVFIALHVWHFKYGPKKVGLTGAEQMAFYERVTSEFQKPLIMSLYVAAMVLLGLHISHGIGSMFQSLGLFSNHRRQVRLIGSLIGWVMVLGFASLPLYASFVLAPIDVKTIPITAPPSR